MRRCMLPLLFTLAWTSDGIGEQIARRTAVVELFTSEGCHSCPPADLLLGQLAAREWDNGEVYALAFHVDYWNGLGWVDRFSNRAFTQRQYRYASTFTETRVYTPQMVVDGQAGFVGSDRARAVGAVDGALAQADVIGVTLEVLDLSSDVARLQYRMSTTRKGLDLNVALVERQTSSDVRRGENAGKLLEHSYVVRAHAVIAVSADPIGKMELKIPDDTDAAALDAIVYVQDRATMTVLGAVSVPLTRGG